MRKKIIVISCGPGLDEVKEEYGHSYQWVQNQSNADNIDFFQYNAYKGLFPNIEEGSAWIITGSAKSAYEDLEWIVELEILIKRAYEVQKPILGICFGHQLIAQALGGVVEKNKKGWELGSSTITFNKRGLSSPIFKNILNEDYFYMSHQDVIMQLPNYAIELAFNNMGNQAYSIGDFIYGVQFHPEFSYEVAKTYADIRYEKGMIDSKLKILESKTSGKVINNFITNLKGNL